MNGLLSSPTSYYFQSRNQTSSQCTPKNKEKFWEIQHANISFFGNSAKAEYCSTFTMSVLQSVTGVVSQLFLMLSISYRPWPSQKTESRWLFYSNTPNIHNMFRLTPWSHGIWFSTDKNIQRSQETGPNFHFLSETLTESESREKVSFKLQPLRGVALSHFPTPPLSSNPSLLKIILQFPLEQGRLLPTGIAWRSRPRGCCSWMVTTWD